MEEYGQEWVNGEVSLAAQKELKGAPFTLLLRMGGWGGEALGGAMESKRH